MYPSCSNLISTFEEKSGKIINLLDDKIKDTSSRRLFESLNDSTADISLSMNSFIFIQDVELIGSGYRIII